MARCMTYVKGGWCMAYVRGGGAWVYDKRVGGKAAGDPQFRVDQ